VLGARPPGAKGFMSARAGRRVRFRSASAPYDRRKRVRANVTASEHARSPRRHANARRLPSPGLPAACLCWPPGDQSRRCWPPRWRPGFAISPTFIAGYALVEQLAPGAALTEGFTWLIAATGIGIAAGSPAGGLAVDLAAARAAFLAAAAAALLAASIALMGRRWLHSPVGASAGPPPVIAEIAT